MAEFSFGWIEGILGVVFYLFLFFIFKKSLKTFLDPLNVYFLLYSFSFIGLIVQPYQGSYYGKVINLFLCLFIGALLGNKAGNINNKENNIKNIPLKFDVSYKLQLILSVSVFTIIFCNLFFNYVITGNIPLLKGGYNERYMSVGSSRILAWLYLALNTIPLVLSSVSQYRVVRLYSNYGLLLILLTLIFQANKASLLFFVILLTNKFYLMKLTGVKLSQKVKLSYTGLGLLFIAITPFYSAFVTKLPILDVLKVMYNRLFLSFDQLIRLVTVKYDIYNENLSLLKWYFAPFVKLFGQANDFDSASEYLLYRVTGLVPGTYNGPVSNLILEVIVSGKSIFISSLLVFVYSFLIFYLRSRVLSKRTLRYRDIFLFSCIVLKPLEFMIMGYLFFVTSLIALLFFILIYYVYFIIYGKYKRVNSL